MDIFTPQHYFLVRILLEPRSFVFDRAKMCLVVARVVNGRK
jgi:hypothetical protein